MSALLKILPGTGRWTRSGRRGRSLSAIAVLGGEIPTPPSVLRTATSPFRGGSKQPVATTPVTLNSFQGPSLPTRRSVVERSARAVGVSTRATGNAAQWVLKQVQHDDVERKAAKA